MTRFASGLLLIVSALLLGYLSSPLPFYLKPGVKRLQEVWTEDLNSLSKNKNFHNTISQLGSVEIHFTDPQVAEEFSGLEAPFVLNREKPLVLRVSITRWIDKSKYGFIVQHEIFDKDDDKIFEFGRTYHIGYIF